VALGKAEKKYLSTAKGINTEAPLTQWPDGYTIDEQNMDLMSDGSRRRRPPIAVEPGVVGIVPEIPPTLVVGAAVPLGGSPYDFTARGVGQYNESGGLIGGGGWLNPPDEGTGNVVNPSSLPGTSLGQGISLTAFYALKDDSVDGGGLFDNGKATSFVVRFCHTSGTPPIETLFDEFNFVDDFGVTRTFTRATADVPAGVVTTYGGVANPAGEFRQWTWTFAATPTFVYPFVNSPVVNFVSSASVTPVDVDPIAETTDAYKVEFWKTVNNDPDKNFVVIQIGPVLYFYDQPDADEKLGDMQTELVIDLRAFKVIIDDLDYETDDADIRAWPVDITFGNGRMFVAGKFTEPFFVEYDPDTDAIGATQIVVVERDFNGIEDGIAMTVQPETLIATHAYNLQNRGWSPANISTYLATTGRYPSKSQIMFRGMQRAITDDLNPDDGIKQFSPNKLLAELFQDSSAPQGHMKLNSFDTRTAAELGGFTFGGRFEGFIHAERVDDTTYDGEFESTAHGLSTGDHINVISLVVHYSESDSVRTYNGVYEILGVPSANSFIIRLKRGHNDDPDNARSGNWTSDEEGSIVTRSDDPADALRFRFTCTQFFAGRVWFAGALDTRLGNKVYFSRVSEDPNKAGQCFQVADPTSEFISELVATDGGVIVIPEMQDVLALLPYGHNLLVFARNGVWQVGPGELGIFSPTSYSVRKVTENGCISARSVVQAEGTPMYWSADGIYAISQDSNTGFLVAESISRDTINNLYMSIPIEGRETARGVYDIYRKRVFWFHNPQIPLQTATPDDDGEGMVSPTPVTPIQEDVDDTRIGYTYALLFDLRLGAWTKWAFATDTDEGQQQAIMEAFVIDNHRITDNETHVKMLVFDMTDETVYFQAFNRDSDTFGDFSNEELLPDAFMASGPDSLGEPAKFRYAPIVTCFYRRIEGASCYMQPRWDWARGTISGKIGEFFQTYRETRPNPNAFAMTVTRNKVPGRGRNLFLFFKITDEADAWLDGYTVNYDVGMKE